MFIMGIVLGTAIGIIAMWLVYRNPSPAFLDIEMGLSKYSVYTLNSDTVKYRNINYSDAYKIVMKNPTALYLRRNST